jgi:Helix-turn-helix domain of resolvase
VAEDGLEALGELAAQPHDRVEVLPHRTHVADAEIVERADQQPLDQGLGAPAAERLSVGQLDQFELAAKLRQVAVAFDPSVRTHLRQLAEEPDRHQCATPGAAGSRASRSCNTRSMPPCEPVIPTSRWTPSISGRIARSMKIEPNSCVATSRIRARASPCLKAGLKAACARGRLGGRRTVITDEKLRVARDMLAGGQHTMQQIADTIGVGRATLYRHLEHGRKAPSSPTPAVPSTPARPAVRSDQVTAHSAQQQPTLAGRAARRAAPKTTAKSAGLPRRPLVGLVADRRLWLQETCPTCQASPGARCRDPRALRKTRLPRTELHFARGWRQRSCPTCHAQPGEGCALRPAAAAQHAPGG